jgi:hypothetical protein
MSSQQLESIQTQSDAPTLILMFILGFIFIISMLVSEKYN